MTAPADTRPRPATGQTTGRAGGAAGYYVAVRTGERLGRTALALGPFSCPDAALAEVDRVRRFVADRFGDGGWWGFDTARVPARPGRPLPAGTLNDVLSAG
ncbi:hypothetical protein [Actinomadura rifamycini]|uniref:hypothetical protein n=1 Tax=Actinomadura rifamycini TaxID=31962 RepID=UPI0004157565|nr:hypothetical protein [Actinomadura rifamycini]